MENQYLRDHVVLISVKVLLGLCVLGYMSSLLGSSEEKHLMEEEANSSTLAEIEAPSPLPIKKTIVLQPHCKPQHSHAILRLILSESFRCRPQDADKEKLKSISVGKKRKFRHQNHQKSKTETTESMVVYVAVGLLLISLGAALLEVFKFPNEPTIKTKPALNRSCSLADLTVMRHNRKELMRRDSVMEGNLESRGPSKLLERRSPLYRRCSFPVAPGDAKYNGVTSDFHASPGLGYRSSRKMSADGAFFPSQHRHAHIRLLHRH